MCSKSSGERDFSSGMIGKPDFYPVARLRSKRSSEAFVYDLGLRPRYARLRKLRDCSSPQVGRSAARGHAGRGWLGLAGPASGSSFVASQACELMATTFFSMNIRQSRARRYCAISVSRSRAHLKLRAKCTRPETPAGEAAVAVHRWCVQSHERGARRDQKMDDGESKVVRRAIVGDLWRPNAGSNRH